MASTLVFEMDSLVLELYLETLATLYVFPNEAPHSPTTTEAGCPIQQLAPLLIIFKTGRGVLWRPPTFLSSCTTITF